MPRNVGEIANPDVVAEVEHKGGGCFDRIRITLQVSDKQVISAMFKARACSGTIAAASAATEWVTGKSLEEAGSLSADLLTEYLDGVPEKKRHSVELAAQAIRKAVSGLQK